MARLMCGKGHEVMDVVCYSCYLEDKETLERKIEELERKLEDLERAFVSFKR